MKSLFLFSLFVLSACTHSAAKPQTEGPLAKLKLESFLLRLSNLKDDLAARQFLKNACTEKFETACDILGESSLDRLRRLPVLQGGTDDTTTELLILTRVVEPLYLLVWGDSLLHPLASLQMGRVPIPQSDREMVSFLVEGLSPGKNYRAQWVTREGQLVDSRTFQTLHTQGRQARIAVASCMDDFDDRLQRKQWAALLEEKPDALFLIGDNVYADLEPDGKSMGPATVEQLWKRYLETRTKLDLFFSEHLVPTFAIWDDHDYGVNDGDRDYPQKNTARQVFSAFFGMPSFPGAVERGPGISFRLDAFGQAFYFLDGRSFRTLSEKKLGLAATQFGRDVEAWLFAGLDGRTPSWLISGAQFFGGYHPFESFEGGFPTAFGKFLARLKNRGTPVVFLSGDRHLTEVMRIEPELLGYETFELTTSAIHAKVYPESFKKFPSPRQIAGRDGQYNFMVIDSKTEGKWELGVRALGEGGKTLYRLTLLPADPATRQ